MGRIAEQVESLIGKDFRCIGKGAPAFLKVRVTKEQHEFGSPPVPCHRVFTSVWWEVGDFLKSHRLWTDKDDEDMRSEVEARRKMASDTAST